MLVRLHLDHRLKPLRHAVVVDEFLIGNLRLARSVVELVFGRLHNQLRGHEPDVVHRVRNALLIGWVDRRAGLGRLAIRVVVDTRSANTCPLEVEIDDPRLTQKGHQRIVGAEPVDHRPLAEEFSADCIPYVETWVCGQCHVASPFLYAAASRVLISPLTRSRAMRIFSIGDLPAISRTPAASEGLGMLG